MRILAGTENRSEVFPCVFTSAALPAAGLQMCVIVPVRNEAEHLWQTLDALRLQTDGQGLPVNHNSYEVLLLVNNCTDDSYAIATAYQRQHPGFQLHIDQIGLPRPQANVGTVRRMLMDEAHRRLCRAENENGIIASTDGDTQVDGQWIHHILEEIASGNDAVGGRILTRGDAGTARRYHLRDVTYRCLLAEAEALLDPQQHDPMPRHFQYFGASLAVTCKMYVQAGRLPHVPHLEDMAFYKALQEQDARIRKSCKVKVYTSARLQGRVNVGFSEQLRKWATEQEDNVVQTVEPVNYSLLLYGLRQRLRQCWKVYHKQGRCNAGELTAIAAQLQVSQSWLQQKLASSTYGLLWHAAEAALEGSCVQLRNQAQPIKEAIAQLRAFISSRPVIAVPANPSGSLLRAGEAAA